MKPAINVITLKNFKHAAFASQETLCFEATVCIEGKKAGHARNDGCGGCTYVHLDTEFRHLDTPENDLEGKVDAIAYDLVAKKQDKQALASTKRELSKHILFRRKDTPAGQSRIFRNAVGSPQEAAIYAKLKADPTVEVIYNHLPLEEATKALRPGYGT